MADQKTLETRSKQGSLADLDPSTATGERVALEPVHQAARLSHQSNYVACIETAMAKATGRLQAMA